MILAVSLSARSDGDTKIQEEAKTAAQAASIMLRHLGSVLPISQGAAETFDETCRGACCAQEVCVKPAWLRLTAHQVCRVPTAPKKESVGSRSKYAWYRPISFHRCRIAMSPGAMLEEADSACWMGAVDLSPLDEEFSVGGVPMLGGDPCVLDFDWLLPGGLGPELVAVDRLG